MRNNDVFIAFVLGVILGMLVTKEIVNVTYSGGGNGMYEFCSTKYDAFENRMACVDVLEQHLMYMPIESPIIVEELEE
jgi:hypothetical protein